MKLIPLQDRVVLKVMEAEETTRGGIILAPAAKEKPSVAEVISVGPGGMVDGNEADDKIIAVLCGEIIEKRKKAGAPIKNSSFNENIPLEIEKIRARICGEEVFEPQPITETEEPNEQNSAPFQLTIIMDKVTPEQKKLLRKLLNTL